MKLYTFEIVSGFTDFSLNIITPETTIDTQCEDTQVSIVNERYNLIGTVSDTKYFKASLLILIRAQTFVNIHRRQLHVPHLSK